jgi:steroid 5-alpha reductase family enzyme
VVGPLVMKPLTLVLLGWVAMAALMAALWLVQRARRDAGVVDVGWAAGLGILAALYAVLGSGDPARRLVVAVLAGTWSLRLAWYILTDRVLGKPEDGRYRMLRARWGDRAQSRFFVFFQVQALLDTVFSLPFLVAMGNPHRALAAWDVAGVAVWVVALAGEAVADRQLSAFRADPANRGRTCRVGLWRLSRHPNYFFEWLHWWSYVLLAVGTAWWVLTLVGPALMLFFLFKVTGIPATEAQALASRGEDYRDYQRTTSVFIPWFPKGAGSGDRGQGSGPQS